MAKSDVDLPNIGGISLDLKSPASPIMTSASGLATDLEKGATVFPSHVRRSFSRHPTDYTGELVRLLDDISTVTHSIGAYVAEGSESIAYGSRESHRGLESAVATRRIYKSLCHDGYACLILDRNLEAPLTMPEDALQGGYVVMLTSLDVDDSSVEQPICGTAFSVYKRRTPTSLPGRLKDIQQKLVDQVAAGYVLYASATTMYYTLGGNHGVYSFCLHPVATQYFLQPSSALSIPESGIGMYCDRAQVRRDAFVGSCVMKYVEASEQPPRMFDAGTLIGNFNQVTTHGGVLIHFDCHLLCEAGPLALILEQMGGKAVDSDGNRILDLGVEDEDVHRKVTIIAGSTKIVDEIIAMLATVDAPTQ